MGGRETIEKDRSIPVHLQRYSYEIVKKGDML